MINAASHQGTASSVKKPVDAIVTRRQAANQGIKASSLEITHRLRVGGVA